jgi:hypothetical protein
MNGMEFSFLVTGRDGWLGANERVGGNDEFLAGSILCLRADFALSYLQIKCRNRSPEKEEEKSESGTRRLPPSSVATTA